MVGSEDTGLVAGGGVVVAAYFQVTPSWSSVRAEETGGLRRHWAGSGSGDTVSGAMAGSRDTGSRAMLSD